MPPISYINFVDFNVTWFAYYKYDGDLWGVGGTGVESRLWKYGQHFSTGVDILWASMYEVI